jgi:hypothetical protein
MKNSNNFEKNKIISNKNHSDNIQNYKFEKSNYLNKYSSIRNSKNNPIKDNKNSPNKNKQKNLMIITDLKDDKFKNIEKSNMDTNLELLKTSQTNDKEFLYDTIEKLENILVNFFCKYFFYIFIC